MIQCDERVFHLRGEDFSCLLYMDDYGLPRQLHFGRPVATGDAASLTADPGLGWGGSVLLEESDPASCPDALPLCWSGSGRGDYRESPVELEDENGPISTDFRYVSHRILPEGAAMTSGLPQAAAGEETLELTLEQPGLRLRLYWTVAGGVLLRRCELENTGEGPVWIGKLMSFCADLPGGYDMTTLDGGWIAEARRSVTPVGRARVVNESTTGFSSYRHNPGFLLSRPGAGEDAGTVYGFNLLWSGNHYSSAQRSLQGLTRVMGGLSPHHLRRRLDPGRCFESPQAVLAWSDKGFNGLSRRMHEFVNGHVIPPYWRGRERPVVYNSWEGCGFDFDQGRLLALARRARRLGCELFVLDDGWFGRRNDDTAGLGDYHVNRKKLPDGLRGLGERLKRVGLDFGLWLEPEGVNPDSELFRAHPDWALTDALPPLTGRHELLLDLTRPEVRDYIVSSVSAVLDSAPISYVKWDMNRHSCALGDKALDYVLGLYDMLRRIFGPRPRILLESCASGGNRFDLGMLTFSPQIWCSDDTDPVERLDIQGGLSLLYPLSAMGAHVSAAPHAQTLRDTPLSTRGNVSFFGVLGYELDLNHLLPVEEREIAAQIAFYKAHRALFQFGRFTRLPAEEGAVAWQVSAPPWHAAGVFHRLLSAAPGYEFLSVKGLEPEGAYQVSSRPQTVRVGRFGALLKHVAPVRLSPHGAVLRIADRHYALDDGAQRVTATGAALMAGWPLPPRFAGTGYDKTLRVQGDFGSSVFEIREDGSHEGSQSEK